jgi:ABC-type sugar transport system ATPase subunit
VRIFSIKTSGDSLFGGNQQKFVLDKWLVCGGRVMIFDDPTSCVDVGSKSEIYQIISDVMKEGT